MKTNNIKVLCVLAFAGSVMSLQAQEDKTKEKDLNRQMTLEREFDPTVQDANKVNTLPEVKEPVVKKIPIDYATYTVATEPAKEITVLPSGKIDTNIDWNKRRGYFNFGAGTYMNINGDAGYHILSTEKDKLNVWFSHRSTNGKVKYIDLDVPKVKAKLNDNIGGLDFQHVFKPFTLDMGLKYGYRSFNYYGLPGLIGLNAPYVPTESELERYNTKTNQVDQTLNARFAITGKENAPFFYKIGLQYNNFTRKYGLYESVDGVKEHDLMADFDFNAEFNGDMKIGLEGEVSYFNYTDPKEKGAAVSNEIKIFENHMEATLSPYYKVSGDNWNILLGAKAMIITGDHSKFTAAPNVSADVEVAEKTVLYLNATGGLSSNSANQVAAINRYVYPQIDLLASRTNLDAILGIKSGIGGSFWFDVFGGYKITKNDLFYPSGIISTAIDNSFANSICPLQANSDKFFAGANLKYSYQNLLELGLKGVYNNWNVSSDNDGGKEDIKAYGKPEMEINANVTVRPMDNISASLDYYLATGRYCYSTEKMKNINELNLTGNYTFNDTFGLYLKLNNVLFQKYEIYQGYPLQSFSAMIGVNINF